MGLRLLLQLLLATSAIIVRFINRQITDEVFTKRRVLKDIGQQRGY